MSKTLRFYRRNLPHWLVAEATYFVTLRLHGTLPAAVMNELMAERENLRLAHATEREWTELERRQFTKIEKILDCFNETGAGLSDMRVAGAVMSNLAWLECRGWKIHAIVLLSNHLHILMRNLAGRSASLLDDLGQFKNFTARTANIILNRRGSFWAREDFDHWVRSPEKFDQAVHYILNNPVRAGLVDDWKKWRWVRVEPELNDLGDRKAAGS